jgi:hypothetical protein
MQSDVQSKVAMKLKRKSGLRLVVAVPGGLHHEYRLETEAA